MGGLPGGFTVEGSFKGKSLGCWGFGFRFRAPASGFMVQGPKV